MTLNDINDQKSETQTGNIPCNMLRLGNTLPKKHQQNDWHKNWANLVGSEVLKSLNLPLVLHRAERRNFKE